MTGKQRRVGSLPTLIALLAVGAICWAASCGAADPVVLFADDFESGLIDWTTAGKASWYAGDPKIGTHAVTLPKKSSIQQTVSTVGWQDITISFWLGASLAKSGTSLQARWFDGTSWTVLAEINDGGPEEDGELHPFEFELPSSASNNSRFALRFWLDSKNPRDAGYVDDVSVTAAGRFMCTLAVVGTGGSVKVDGVDRALPWSGLYDYGATVVLQAVPDIGYHFTGWSGALSGSASPTTVLMDGDKHVTATFTIDTYTLTVSTGTGGGGVLVDGVARPLPWVGTFDRGAVVQLEAIPDSAYHFTGWSGGLTGTANPVALTMDGDQSVSAGFASNTYVVHLSGAGSGGVEVDGFHHALPDTITVAYDSTVTLQPVPGIGWHFAGWSGDLAGMAEPASLLVDSDKDVTVTFLRNEYLLELSGLGSGSVVVDGAEHMLPWSAVFEHGEAVVLEAVPAAGSHFISWQGDLSGAASPTWIVMDNPKSIVASFGLNTYTLTIDGTNGRVEVNGALKALPWAGPFSAGEVVSLEALPVEGYHFVAWSGDLGGAVNPTAITMDGDHLVSVEFAAEIFNLSVSGSHGSLNVDDAAAALPYSASYGYGTVVSLEAIPESGYSFLGWSGDLTGIANPTDVTILGDTSVTANFSAGGYLLALSGSGGAVKVDGVVRSLPWSGEYDYGSEVTLEAVADSCMRFMGWSGDLIDDGNPAAVAIYSSTSIAAEFASIVIFTDVECDFWAAREIAACFFEGAVTGYPDGSYQPTVVVSRDQMAVYISRALAGGDGNVPGPVGDLAFTDVAADHWAYTYIEYAVHNHIVQGYPEGDYRPSAAVTRDQMAVYVARAIVDPTGEDGLAGYMPPPTPSFPDVAAGFWAYKHIEYCVSQGVVRGYEDGSYHPEIPVTRDQMAVYVARAFGLPM